MNVKNFTEKPQTGRLLKQEKEACNRYLPGLDSDLAVFDLMTLEAKDNPGVAAFRKAGGSGLLIPTLHGGCGASAVDAVRVMRAIAARSPSLAIATTMHHFSVASLVALVDNSEGPEWMLLDALTTQKRLMASGFAEGRAASSILKPTMTGEWDGKNWLISGVKKPCSLSRSMDILTASVLLSHPEEGQRTAVALIPAESKGISITPFWNSWVLNGAESDAVTLENVEVHPDLIVDMESSSESTLDDLQTVGFIWFELLLTASYLGVAMSLVKDLLASKRGSNSERIALCSAIEGAAMQLDGFANTLDSGKIGNDELARALIVRFAIADTIQSCVAKTVELLGGMAFINSSDVAYRAACCHAIGFHPPSRQSSADALLDWFEGDRIVLQ